MFQEVVRTSLHPPFGKKQYPLFPVESKHFSQGRRFADFRKESVRTKNRKTSAQSSRLSSGNLDFT